MKSRNNKFINRFGLLVLMFGIFAVGLSAQTKTPSKTELKPLPDLKLDTIGGEKWSLHQQRGNVVLLNFWATWCAPCREEVPVLINLSEKYKKKNLKIVGVNVDSEDLKLVNKFIKEFKMDYTVLLTVPGSLLSQQENVPVTLLIDEESRLIKKYVGAVDESLLEKDIENLLNKNQKKAVKSKSKNGKGK
jgi:thiol-disulfide isomerase/thioredoxin